LALEVLYLNWAELQPLIETLQDWAPLVIAEFEAFGERASLNSLY